MKKVVVSILKFIQSLFVKKDCCR